ncbi:MAG: helix-turn-helix transcriptional regulator [Clostridia bacterium]|nr:helix-turn-helix transcriptional regulator [Clostridia bacterium]
MRSSAVNYPQIGQRIRAARKNKGWTQQQLAERINVSTSYIGHIEHGLKSFALDTLFSLCDTLEISADYLLFGKVSPYLEREVIRNYLEDQLHNLLLPDRSVFR